MASEIFGVDAAHFATYWPQVDVASDAPITAARLARAIADAADEVAAVINATWGSGAIEAIAADTDTPAYRNCARLIVQLAAPEVLRATHHLLEGSTEAQDRADALRDRLRRSPEVTIGYLRADAPQSATSTQGLSTSADDRATRRKFDGRAGGRNEGGWVY